MKKGWTITKLVTVGSIGALRVLVWLPFVVISGASANPISMIFSFFFYSFISILSMLIVRQLGTLTLQTFVEYTLELPLPNMIFKPLVYALAFIRSLIVDFIFQKLNKNRISTSIICGVMNSFLLYILTYISYMIMNIPGASQIPSSLLTPVIASVLIGVVMLLGGLGGYLGWLTYQKIKNTSVVIRIQGNEKVLDNN